MIEPTLEFPVLDCKAQKKVYANLSAMTDKHMADFQTFWKERLAPQEDEDAHWDWLKKYEIFKLQPSYEKFAVEVNNITQGLMLIELDLHRSKLAEGKSMIYIDYLSTAPWNRRTEPQPNYKGIGSGLISYAILRSVELEYQGRIGLHALPQAEEFYIKFGFQDFGRDSRKQNLKYFELGMDVSLEIAERFETQIASQKV